MESVAHIGIIQAINTWPAYRPSNHHPEPTNQSAYILNNVRSLHAMMPTDCDCVNPVTEFKSIWHTKGMWGVIIEALHARLKILQRTQAEKIGSMVRKRKWFCCNSTGVQKAEKRGLHSSKLHWVTSPSTAAVAHRHCNKTFTIPQCSQHTHSIKYKYLHNHIHINTVQRETTSTFGCFTIVQNKCFNSI